MSSMPSPPRRDVLVIAILIAGVCFVTLAPSLYIAFHALRWEKALQVLEVVFLAGTLYRWDWCPVRLPTHQGRRQILAENGVPRESKD